MLSYLVDDPRDGPAGRQQHSLRFAAPAWIRLQHSTNSLAADLMLIREQSYEERWSIRWLVPEGGTRVVARASKARRASTAQIESDLLSSRRLVEKGLANFFLDSERMQTFPTISLSLSGRNKVQLRFVLRPKRLGDGDLLTRGVAGPSPAEMRYISIGIEE